MIETSRLILTIPSLADFDESYALSSDDTVMEFISGKPVSREDAWNKFIRNIGHWSAFGFGIFTVRQKESGEFVGEIGLAHFMRGLGEAFDPYPEAAWVLATKFHGNGYATEATRAAHDWMTQSHRPARTVCIIDPKNCASLRVADKLGYIAFGEAQYRGVSPVMLRRL